MRVRPQPRANSVVTFVALAAYMQRIAAARWSVACETNDWLLRRQWHRESMKKNKICERPSPHQNNAKRIPLDESGRMKNAQKARPINGEEKNVLGDGLKEIEKETRGDQARD
uniref:Uncharacterized protein n=1 Tax=Pristionchus pacificus TaxID=54126 RepID=A0A2A6B700_PRIPA|eukprot:PDM61641.1 hypothetical protein PRIPAC_51083 [Pristionchus pacificus]